MTLTELQSDWDVQIPFPGQRTVLLFNRPLFPCRGWGLGMRLTQGKNLSKNLFRWMKKKRTAPHYIVHVFSGSLGLLGLDSLYSCYWPSIGLYFIVFFSQWCTYIPWRKGFTELSWLDVACDCRECPDSLHIALNTPLTPLHSNDVMLITNQTFWLVKTWRHTE